MQGKGDDGLDLAFLETHEPERLDPQAAYCSGVG
jgi:hypothetical protein